MLDLNIAAKELAASLRSHADALYLAQQAAPDEQLKAAHQKVQRARKIVTDMETLRDLPDIEVLEDAGLLCRRIDPTEPSSTDAESDD